MGTGFSAGNIGQFRIMSDPVMGVFKVSFLDIDSGLSLSQGVNDRRWSSRRRSWRSKAFRILEPHVSMLSKGQQLRFDHVPSTLIIGLTLIEDPSLDTHRALLAWYIYRTPAAPSHIESY